VRAREALFRQASEFYAEGVKAKLDVTKAQADLAAARSDLIMAENDVALAWEELQNSLGQELPPETALADELEVAAPSPKLDEALKQAFERRPEWLQLMAQRQVVEGSLQTAFAGYLPSVSGEASYGYIEQAFPPEERFWTAGVTVNLPLFTGFLTREQVAEARANLQVLDENEANARLDITKEVKQALVNATDGESQVVAAREALAAARENQRVAETRYGEGVGTIIEVTDAQAQAYQSETAYAQALYNLKTAQAALNKAVGMPY
jgi:outer membrane protein TolC